MIPLPVTVVNRNSLQLLDISVNCHHQPLFSAVTIYRRPLPLNLVDSLFATNNPFTECTHSLLFQHQSVRCREDLVVLSAALQDELGVVTSEGDVVNHHHQRELGVQLPLTSPSLPHLTVDQHIVHLLARCCSLQLLSVQHLALQLLPRLPSIPPSSPTFPVCANSVAHFTLRPPQQVVIKSATPELWKKVVFFTPL